MKPTGTFYDVIIRLGYYSEIVIEKIELIDLLTIIPVLDRIKFKDHSDEKNVEIIIQKRAEEGHVDAEIPECL